MYMHILSLSDCPCPPPLPRAPDVVGASPSQPPSLGAKDCTQEIDTSEIIVTIQWHFPMDFRWHFPTEFHIPVVFSKGLSLVR